MDIQGKVGIVTGGASGLGQATVEQLIAEGARVAIFDVNKACGAALAARCQDKAIALPVDITDEASVTAGIATTMEAFGAVHILVNCAGIGTAGRTLGRKGPLPLSEFCRTINVNLIGTFNVLRLAAVEMSKNEPEGGDGERGVIINTASIAGYEGQTGQAAYSASKAGIIGMTLPVARDLASHGIRVCTIAPGLFDTPMVGAVPEPVRAQLISQLEFPRRMGRPSEFAELAAHIIHNRYINAEVIRLDCGTRPPRAT
jgi:NAD(P)-dependent dehydrogenase (short-subunit alcohol dehydrogenase family)